MHIVAIILTVQAAVLAAPSENPKEINTNAEQQVTNDGQDTNDLKGSHRHKRWYNHFGYGFPPVSPVAYPTNKRDNAQETGNYGTQDEPFTQIYSRLQEILGYTRQLSYIPPPPLQIPVYLPVVLVPQIGCGCTPTQEVAPASGTNETSPGIENRFPLLNDSRQNWGFAVNNNNVDPIETDYVDDSIRPVNFDPVTSNIPSSRPPPQVEHGSSQAGSSSGLADEQREQSLGFAPSTTINPFEENTISPLTACDGAILSCCHQVETTSDCFASRGCQNITDFAKACSIETIRLVLDRFQRYYEQRS